MGYQICYVILCHSIKTGEIAVAGVNVDKAQAESRCAELSETFKELNRFEIQSSILETPNAAE